MLTTTFKVFQYESRVYFEGWGRIRLVVIALNHFPQTKQSSWLYFFDNNFPLINTSSDAIVIYHVFFSLVLLQFNVQRSSLKDRHL